MNRLLHKIEKRLGKIAAQLIPYQTHYRPVGVCPIGPANQSLLQVHSIYPAHETRLTITETLYQACSTYWKPQRSVITDYVVVEVPQGRIHTDNESSVAIISRENTLVAHVSLTLVGGKVAAPVQNNIFRQHYFKTPKQLKGTVFSLLTGGAGLNNISHWFLDVLPRLHLLQQSGLYDQVDWFLVPSLQYSYQTETLALLGIPAEKLISAVQHPHLQADRVIASTAPRGDHTLVPSWVCTYLRNAFLPAQTPEQHTSKPDGIYISRSDSKIRNVRNEKELVAALMPYGFTEIISSTLSIKEKIRLFSQAGTVVSATGAGLISLLFCKPGTKVIELFHEGFVIEPFFDIATKLGLDYHYLISKGNTVVSNATQGQREDLRVDIPRLIGLLHEIGIDTATEGPAHQGLPSVTAAL